MKLVQLIIWHAVYGHEIEAPKISRLRGEDEALEYAEFWILTNPDDIVMLVEIELGLCKHCDYPIQEKPGWVLHKWMHISTRRYTCKDNYHNKAEPKEVR